MPARRPIRTLLGLSAGLTVTALFGATLAVPASAGPLDRHDTDLAARKLDGKATALPDKWFVQVSGKPSLRGGSRVAARANQTSVKRAASDAGVKYSVLHSYTRVWNGFSVKAGTADVQKLRTLSGVAAVYPVYTVKLPESVSKPELAYSLPMIGAPMAQVEGYKGTGIKVGVIDTGIDYNHPDLGGSGTEGNNADFGPSAPRVKYGYDFAGDHYDADSTSPGAAPVEDPYPDDCNGHGTHVSGIIGANGDPSDGGAVGVAPEVTFGAYRVFGCEGSADTEVILAAMEQAAADDMDVVNMSLGGEFDSWPDYPEAAAASALTASGTLVVASAGNEAADGLFTAGTPSVGKDVISVGSVENTKSTNWVFTLTPALPSVDSAIAYAAGEPGPSVPSSGSESLAPASVKNGCTPFTGVTGKFAVVQRGNCAFYDKALNAQEAGATGLVIFNDKADGVFAPSLDGDEAITIPVVFIDKADGDALWTQLGSTSTSLTWTDTTEAGDNPEAGAISDFSTFGMAANLAMTPDVSAPGGNIFSTFPLEKKGYANLSGTSMASPHVAGAVALLLQAKSSLKGDVNAVRSALQNTATPIDKANLFGAGGENIVDGLYEPTIRQGAGLIHIDKAIASTLAGTTVAPGKINLGENRSSYYKTTLKLTNNGSTSEKYTLSVQNALNIGAAPTTYWYSYNDRKVSSKFSSSSVTVKAHKTATVSVYLKQPSLTTGWIYGGWVKLTKSDKSKTLVVPFAGMYGDYQKVKVLQDQFGLDDATQDIVTLKDLPALATYDGLDAESQPIYTLLSGSPRHTFTLADDESSPQLLFHFDYPVSAAYFNVYKASTTGGKGAEVFPGYKTFFKLDEYGRDNSFLALQFDGKIPFSSSTSSGLRVPDGNYVLEIRVLKALGNASTSSHWETYVTPAFTIDRSVG